MLFRMLLAGKKVRPPCLEWRKKDLGEQIS